MKDVNTPPPKPEVSPRRRRSDNAKYAFKKIHEELNSQEETIKKTANRTLVVSLVTLAATVLGVFVAVHSARNHH